MVISRNVDLEFDSMKYYCERMRLCWWAVIVEFLFTRLLDTQIFHLLEIEYPYSVILTLGEVRGQWQRQANGPNI